MELEVFNCEISRACDRCLLAEKRVVLVKSGIALSDHLDVMRPVGKTAERQQKSNGAFGAPRTTVQAKLIGRVAGAIWPAACGDAKPRTIESDDKADICLGCQHRFTVDRSTDRDHTAFVLPVNAGANPRRARLQTEPIAH